ncbi:MAG TPA: HAMP domain-containing protein [Anaerolineae bacterium]|nr:HAMP domain-containing protein [Anaerolineae bacterium]
MNFLKRLAPPVAFALGISGVLITAVVTIEVVMRPPAKDLNVIIGYMIISSLGSLGAGYVLYRFGWWRWSGHIFFTLTLGVVIQAIVVFFNVWLTARSMLINQHDLDLTSMLLLFGIGIGIAFGAFAAASLTQRITQLRHAARSIASGDLSTRVDVKGHDELAELGTTINSMTTQLEASAQKQKELDHMRRDLIAWASHDLRTPLTSIRVVVEALADGVVDDPDSRQRYLASLQADVRSLSRMIDDLFEIAQIDAGGLKLDLIPCSLHDVISDVLTRMRALADARQITLDGRVDPALQPVQIDPPKFERVLVNLIDNALRHTSAGGRVEVLADRAGENNRI